MCTYELKRSSDAQYMFNLKARNGQVILTSERYTTKLSALNGIESVRTNSPVDSRYSRLVNTAGRPYFTLLAANGQVIGRSEAYSSPAARDNGVEAVKTCGPTGTVTDLA